MASIVKNLNGKTILEDGKTIKEWKDEAEFDPSAADNEQPIQLIVVDDNDGANFCTSCGSRNIYCVNEGGIAYQLVCRDCGHAIGFRTRQDIDVVKHGKAEKAAE